MKKFIGKFQRKHHKTSTIILSPCNLFYLKEHSFPKLALLSQLAIPLQKPPNFFVPPEFVEHLSTDHELHWNHHLLLLHPRSPRNHHVLQRQTHSKSIEYASANDGNKSKLAEKARNSNDGSIWFHMVQYGSIWFHMFFMCLFVFFITFFKVG